MRKRGPFSGRSAVEWGVRGALAVVAAMAGAYCVALSLASAVAPANPEFARSLAPGDGRIAARLAVSLSGPQATAADRSRADQLAREALRHDPTAVMAVSAMGINAQIRGDVAGARRLFAYSQKLSRRDVQTQIWAIEDAVGRDDIDSALQHYDIALRTSPATSELLYPVLSTASAELAIRNALVKTLAGKPAWGESFVNYAAADTANARSSTLLLQALQRAGVAVPESARVGAVNALVAGGFADDAWAYYASMQPGVDRRRSRDPAFAAAGQASSQFDWTPLHDTGISASIQRGDHGGLFDFAAPATVGGSLLQQMQMLPPGEYRLEGHSIGIDQVENARPYWTLRCQDGRELGRVVLPNSSEAGGSFRGQFSVPTGCPTQMLVLMARPSDAVSGLSGQIDRVQLSPLK